MVTWLARPPAVWTLMLVSSFVLGGCYAGVKAYPASSDKQTEGIRYFLPAPYLVVERTISGTQSLWDARFETIPDTGRVFLLQPYTYFAKQDATIELNPDGTLKSVALTQESTQVSAAVVEAVKQVWTKKLEIDKAAADAERSAAGARSDEPVQKKIWLIPIRGAVLIKPDPIDLTFPRVKPSVPEPTGKVEGTFSIPVGGGRIERGDTSQDRR